MRERRWRRLAVTAGSAGLGFALMYYLDREHGAARRRATWRRVSGIADRARLHVAGLLEPSPGRRAGPARHVTHLTMDAAGARSAPAARIVSFDEGAPPEEALPEPEAEPAPGRRRAAAAIALLAAAMALAAAGSATWLAIRDDSSSQPQPARAASDNTAYAISLISRPGAERIPVSGASGSLILVVAPDGEAALIVSDVPRAPRDKTYEAWVVVGGSAKQAALFQGGEAAEVLRLAHSVPKGALVAVSLEPAGGVDRSDNQPLYVATRS